LAQCIDIDLRIDPRAVCALVPQKLTDLRKRGSGPQQICRQAVTEQVGTSVRVTVNTGQIERLLCDHRNRAARGEADVRCQHA
jgi:hypothetical protein